MTQFVQDFLGLWVDGVAGLDFEVSVSLGVAGLGLVLAVTLVWCDS